MRGVVVEDEGWHHTAQVGKAGQAAEKDVEMALLFPFAPIATSPSLSSSLPSEGGEYYFTNPTLPKRQQRRPEQLDWKNMLSPSQHSPYTVEESLHDNYSGEEEMTLTSPADLHARCSPISGYESLRDSDFASEDPYFHHTPSSPVKAATTTHKSGEYEGLEGIYKFLQICEEVKR